MCPDRSNGTGRSFKIRRSSLSRSPTFIDFFKSSHYLAGCEMQITFMSDPAACFQIVQSYLDEGPDVYTNTKLRVFVTVHYRITDRFVVLVRLHSLAKKLALPGLMYMAYDVILQIERMVIPSSCITIASIVFSKSAEFDRMLKDWIWKHIGYHFLALKNIKEWDNILKSHESELNGLWSKTVEAHSAVVAAIQEEKDDKALVKVISGLSTESQGNAISAIEDQEMTFEQFIDKMSKDGAHQPKDDDWDHVDDFINKEDPVTNDAKAREVLGMSPAEGTTPEKKVIGLSRSQSMPSDTAKARAVMGMDESFGRADGRKLIKPDRVKPDRSSKLFSIFD